MASYVSNFVAWTTTAGNKNVSVTTPQLGDLIVVAAGQSAVSTVGTVADDQGGTYTAIRTATRSGTVGAITWFIRNTRITSTSTHIVTWTSPGGDSGGGLDAFLVRGMSKTGAAAARQTAIVENGGAGGTPAPVFGSTTLTANMTFGAGINATSPFGTVQPSGASERQDLGYSTPTFGLHTWTRDSGFVGTTVTYGGTSASAYSIVILELDTSPNRYDPPAPRVGKFLTSPRMGPPILVSQRFPEITSVAAPVTDTASIINTSGF